MTATDAIKNVPPKTWAIVAIAGAGIGLFLRRRNKANVAAAVPVTADGTDYYADDGSAAYGDYGRSPTSYPYSGTSPTTPTDDPIYGVVASVRDQVEQETLRRIQAGIGGGTTPTTPTTPTPPAGVGTNVDAGGQITPEPVSQTQVSAAKVAASGGNPYAAGWKPRYAS